MWLAIAVSIAVWLSALLSVSDPLRVSMPASELVSTWSRRWLHLHWNQFPPRSHAAPLPGRTGAGKAPCRSQHRTPASLRPMGVSAVGVTCVVCACVCAYRDKCCLHAWLEHAYVYMQFISCTHLDIRVYVRMTHLWAFRERSRFRAQTWRCR